MIILPNAFNHTNLRNTEIGDLQRLVGRQKKVPRLDVLVYDALAVKILETIDQLAEVAVSKQMKTNYRKMWHKKYTMTLKNL